MNSINIIKNWLTVDMAIDMGSARTRILLRGEGIVLDEPSFVTVSYRDGEILAAGKESYKMWGRCPQNIEVVKPLSRGMIENFELAEEMLRRFLDRVFKRKALLGARMVMVVPAGATDVEKKAFEDIALQVGGREVFLVEAPIAAAVGMGLRVKKETGAVVLYCGGATTQAVMLSGGVTMFSYCSAVGGDTLTDAIVAGVRKKHRTIIGIHTAEQLKIQMGSAYTVDKEETKEVYGKGVEDGLPRAVTVSNKDILDMLSPPLDTTVKSIREILGKVPPELAKDVSHTGIYVTGGNSMIRGFSKLVEHVTGLKCRMPGEGMSACINGAGTIVSNIQNYKEFTTSSLSRRFI